MCENLNANLILFAGGIYLLHKDAIFAKSQQVIAFEKKKKNLFLSIKIWTIFRIFFTGINLQF